MSGTYITLINSTLARLNEVQLTTGTFANARGIQTQAKCVNEAIRYINQKEFAYPTNRNRNKNTYSRYS